MRKDKKNLKEKMREGVKVRYPGTFFEHSLAQIHDAVLFYSGILTFI
jgi:hypothetical protein